MTASGYSGISWEQQAAILAGVSVKYNIPITALLGIYGQETSFGTDHSTSRTGAVGPFQFEPSNFAKYGYPNTDTPNLQQFQQQANAFGKYLIANNPSKSASGWAPAMGGGYSEAQAESNLAHIPAPLHNALGQALLNAEASVGTNPANLPGVKQGIAAASAAASAAGTIGNIAELVTSTQFWLRLGEALLGVMLLILGLRAVTGGDGNPASVAKSVGKKAAKAATVAAVV